MEKAKHLRIIISIVVFLILCGVGVFALVNRPQPQPVAVVTSSSVPSSSMSSETVSSSVSSQASSNGIKGKDGLLGTDPNEKAVRDNLAAQGYTQKDIDDAIKQGYQDGTFQNTTGSTSSSKQSTSSGTTSKSSGTTSKSSGGSQGEDHSIPLPPGVHISHETGGGATVINPGDGSTNPGTAADGILQ